MENGRHGSTSDLWPIAKAFGFQYDSSLTHSENTDRLFNYLSVRKKWYETDTFKSIAAFMSSLDKTVSSSPELQEMGFEFSYKKEVLSFNFDTNAIPEYVEILAQTDAMPGLTLAEFYDLFIQIAQYSRLSW